MLQKVSIIGAGISGLYLANLFKNKKDYKVTIYEKKDSIEINEGYGIQLSVNSVELLNKIGFNSVPYEEKFNPQNIDFWDANFDANIKKLDKSKPIIVYCKSGGRSAKCASKLAAKGFEKIYDLKGGFSQWKLRGKEIQK